jgi:hypothetical protein
MTGSSTKLKREVVGAPLGHAHPLGAAASPLYIEGWEIPLQTHYFSPLSLPPPATPPFGLWIGEALPNSFLHHHHHHHVVVLLEILVDLLLPLPQWIEGMEVAIEPYV